MGFFTHWGRPSKKNEPDHPKYRIVKEEWPNGKVRFWIEEWANHYAAENGFWLPIIFKEDKSSYFYTLEEAKKKLDSLFLPLEEPIVTVVEER